jgi:hypothetical protein
MITFICRTCGEDRELSFDLPDGWFWCSEECRQEFARVVDHLAAGGDPGELGLDPESMLFREAVREVQARRRVERLYARDVREAEYERNRPRPMKRLYPC